MGTSEGMLGLEMEAEFWFTLFSLSHSGSPSTLLPCNVACSEGMLEFIVFWHFLLYLHQSVFDLLSIP